MLWDIITLFRAIYKYFCTYFARNTVIMIIFGKNKEMDHFFGRQEEIAELKRRLELLERKDDERY